MKSYQRYIKGFTLVEMLLVLAVIGVMFSMILGYTQQKINQFRRDKTALVMQEVLNAALAYYVNNGQWPPLIGTAVDPGGSRIQSLVNAKYITASMMNSAYWNGGAPAGFWAQVINNGNNFELMLGAIPMVEIDILAGMVPMGHVDTVNSVLLSDVTIPGQNLNNARSVNFASLYHNGGCVPVPTCPGTMTPQIMVAPVSVSGLYDLNIGASNTQVYPITSFTAYAMGPSATPPACVSSDTVLSCPVVTGMTYWRACLSILTPKGLVAGPTTSNSSTSSFGGSVTLMAITRCAPASEPAGSSFSVWE